MLSPTPPHLHLAIQFSHGWLAVTGTAVYIKKKRGSCQSSDWRRKRELDIIYMYYMNSLEHAVLCCALMNEGISCLHTPDLSLSGIVCCDINTSRLNPNARPTHCRRTGHRMEKNSHDTKATDEQSANALQNTTDEKKWRENFILKRRGACHVWKQTKRWLFRGVRITSHEVPNYKENLKLRGSSEPPDMRVSSYNIATL